MNGDKPATGQDRTCLLRTAGYREKIFAWCRFACLERKAEFPGILNIWKYDIDRDLLLEPDGTKHKVTLAPHDSLAVLVQCGVTVAQVKKVLRCTG